MIPAPIISPLHLVLEEVELLLQLLHVELAVALLVHPLEGATQALKLLCEITQNRRTNMSGGDAEVKKSICSGMGRAARGTRDKTADCPHRMSLKRGRG
eukprot:17253-Pleurochrysis_carterae.AAC.1